MTESAMPYSPLRKEMRQAARAIFNHALAECSISRAFSRQLEFADGRLHIAGHQNDLATQSRVIVISIGKAGHTMAEALSRIVPRTFEGVVSCPTRPETPVSGLQYFLGGHPMPNEESLRAGKAILEALRGLTADSIVLFCISGGASAIAEWPLDSALTLPDLVVAYRALVHSGAPIAEINAIRKHLSAVKGGRMAKTAFPAAQISLLVSDVPDNCLDALASGPTMPDSSTVRDCYSIAERFGMLPDFPAKIRQTFERRSLVETPKASDAEFSNSRYFTLLSNRTAVEAAASQAKELGFSVEVDNTCDDWDYARAADFLLIKLRQLRREREHVCLVSGGEVTVKVSAKSGMGGRNQQFALYCASRVQGEAITVLSAGTDGIDGNSSAAGAMIDGSTITRATSAGYDPVRELAEFNAFPIFDAIGDSIITGPTGNNVRDLRVLLAY